MTSALTPSNARRDRRRQARPGAARRLARTVLWRLSDWTYRRGWAARLARRLGLQGRLRIREHEFVLSRPASATPIRMVFASDFHAGPLTDPGMLDDACRAIADAQPDLVLLGGDFVARRARDVDTLVPALAQLAPPLGIYAVLGNHDYLGEEEHIARALRDAGITLLVNESVRLPVPHDDVTICGLDDPIYGAPDAEATLSGASEARIVLMHAPDGLLELGTEPFDLALCGHTHGGQIALPFGIPIVVPKGRLSRRYSRGEYALRNGGRLLVSRGIGCSSVPIRLFSTPEIHLCTLRSAP